MFNSPTNLVNFTVKSEGVPNLTFTLSDIHDHFNATSNFTPFTWNDNLHDRVDYFFRQPHFIVSLILGFATFLANVMSIAAIHHIKRTMTTHIRLIVSLNAADLLVSVSLLLNLFNMLFNPVLPIGLYTAEERQSSACMIAFIFALHQMATQISILNIMAMAVDHYMAVIKPLVYLTQSSKRQWVGIIIGMWFVSFCGGFSGFLTGVNSYKKTWAFNYCEFITNSGDYHPEFTTWAMALIAALTIIFIYLRICCEVCHVNSQMSNIRQGYIKNQKAIQTTLFIIVTFVICWLPTCFFQVMMIIQVTEDETRIRTMIASLFQVNKYLNHLYLLNSLLDPIIYAFRLREMQQGYRCLFLHCLHCSCACEKGDKRYASSFRYNKDFTSMTSTVERGCLVNGQESRVLRLESCRFVFPGRRIALRKPYADRGYSDSKCLQDQMVLLQEVANQQKALKGRPDQSANQANGVCTKCRASQADLNNPRSALCHSNSEDFNGTCKSRCYRKDEGHSSHRYPAKRQPSQHAAEYMMSGNGRPWCHCTTSV